MFRNRDERRPESKDAPLSGSRRREHATPRTRPDPVHYPLASAHRPSGRTTPTSSPDGSTPSGSWCSAGRGPSCCSSLTRWLPRAFTITATSALAAGRGETPAPHRRRDARPHVRQRGGTRADAAASFEASIGASTASCKAAVGPFPAGTRYSAEDPALVLWVHLTLIESIVLIYEPLWCSRSRSTSATTTARRQRLSQSRSAPRSAAVPRTWHALLTALDSAYASGRIVIGPTARELARAVLRPRGAALAGPATWTQRDAGGRAAAARDSRGVRLSLERCRVSADLLADDGALASRALPPRSTPWSAAQPPHGRDLRSFS